MCEFFDEPSVYLLHIESFQNWIFLGDDLEQQIFETGVQLNVIAEAETRLLKLFLLVLGWTELSVLLGQDIESLESIDTVFEELIVSE